MAEEDDISIAEVDLGNGQGRARAVDGSAEPRVDEGVGARHASLGTIRRQASQEHARRRLGARSSQAESPQHVPVANGDARDAASLTVAAPHLSSALAKWPPHR